MAHVLIVEDDFDLADSVRDWLLLQRHTADVVNNGPKALEYLGQRHYDVVILDLSLPVIGGTEICKRYRAANGQARILMLTGKAAITDKEIGFEAGADDYLCKPCDLKEISLRVNALLRRPQQMMQPTIVIGDLIVDTGTHKVVRSGKEIKIMPQEFVLLEFLARHPNRIFSAEFLINRLWHGQSSSDTVRTHIKTLRKKLDVPGLEPVITTVHGVGYSLVSL